MCASPWLCCRQVRDFLQRVRSRRFPSIMDGIELDMKMVLARPCRRCGAAQMTWPKRTLLNFSA